MTARSFSVNIALKCGHVLLLQAAEGSRMHLLKPEEEMQVFLVAGLVYHFVTAFKGIA